MIIGFNPNYPALHMFEALQSILDGDDRFTADEVQSVIDEANTLISERGKSFTQYELSKITALVDSVKEAE